MANLLNNKNRITLASFLAYFVMSGMLAPIGIISAPMAEVFDRSITDVTAQFSWLTIGNLTGAILALFVFDFLRVRTVFAIAYVLIVASLLSLNVVTGLNAIGIALGVVGVCCGLGLATAALVISKTYEAEQRAAMLVVTDASFSVAGFSGAAMATAFLAAGYFWGANYQFVAAIAMLILVLVFTSRFPEAQQDNAQAEENGTWPMATWLCIGALFLYTLGQYSMLWWLPNYVTSELGATPEEGGDLVFRFWLGLFVSQLIVAWWVTKIGVTRLVAIAAILTCLFSIPLWAYGEYSLLPIFALAWGVANFSLLKVVLSYATQTVDNPSGRLVSTLLLGATLGTAVSPWVTSQIVVATDNFFILQFSTICYALLAVLLLTALRLDRNRTKSG